MDVTEFGIVILVNDLQYLNACPPIEVTELGIVTLVSESQLLKAL